MPATLTYNPIVFTLSVAIAIVVSLVALVLAFRLRADTISATDWRRFGSMLVMGAAIPAMHYTGMAAAHFAPSAVLPELRSALPISSLGTAAIAGSTFAVLALAIGTSLLDRRLSAQAQALQASELRLQQVLAASTAVTYAAEMVGADFRPTWVSENIGRMTGYDPAEALHRRGGWITCTRRIGAACWPRYQPYCHTASSRRSTASTTRAEPTSGCTTPHGCSATWPDDRRRRLASGSTLPSANRPRRRSDKHGMSPSRPPAPVALSWRT
jgi:PAS domain-containing protein